MSFFPLNPGLLPDHEEASMSPFIQFGIPAAMLAYNMGGPAIAQKMGGVTGQIWQGLSFIKQKADAEFDAYAPQSVKKMTKLTGNLLNLAGKVAYYGVVTLDEMVDFANIGGTKNPLTSIDASYRRLGMHDQRFAECCEFLADQAIVQYAQYEDVVKEKINDIIKDYPLSSGVNWFVDANQQLIEQTIKANILHLIANLADQAFDQNHPFADLQRNPIGRLVSVVVNCLADYEDLLEDIAQLPEDEQEEEYKEAFQEISSDLLSKFFPNGAQDLQIFHHMLPVKLLKEIIWDQINQALPNGLQLLYLQTRPLIEEHVDWKDNFKDEACGLEVDLLVSLPTIFIQYFVRSTQGRAIDDLEPIFENFLKENGVSKAQASKFSLILIKYLKEFSLTKDSALHKMGAFFERYFMEHLLFNLSESVPDDVDVEISMPLYILNKLINGEFFKMVRRTLSGEDQFLEDQEKAIQEALAPFGLDQKETFPLPSLIKEIVWPSIQNFQENILPGLVFSYIPQWMSLLQIGQHQDELTAGFDDDPSLVNSISNLIEMITDKGMLELPQANLLIGQKLNDLFASPLLSQDQQQKIDEQWQNLLKENDSLDILQDFGQQCIEALVLQLCKDLYVQYQKAVALDNLDSFSDDDAVSDEEEDKTKLPFATWLFLKAANACNQLSIGDLSDDEREIWQKAIQLKNAILSSTDPIQSGQDRDELNQLWPMLQPKYDDLCQHLLEILGYQQAADLPFPAEIQPIIWDQLVANLPYLIFENSSDFLLPILEKQDLQAKVLALPQGIFIQQGCKLLSQDIVQHLPHWVDGRIEPLPEEVMEQIPEVELSDKARQCIVETLNAIVQVDDPIYEPLWEWVQSYLEGLFLKVANKIGHMGQNDLDAIQALVKKTKDDLLALEQIDNEDEVFDEIEDEIFDEGIDDQNEASSKDKNELEKQTIIETFTVQLFAHLGIETSQDLFGIPPILQPPVLKLVKEKFAQVLLGTYQVENRIRHHIVNSNPIEEHLPASQVARASISLIRLILDNATESLSERIGGEVQAVDQLYESLNTWLGEKEQEGYQFATLLQTVINRQIPTPFLIDAFDLLNTDIVQPYKRDFADWINPLLTDQVIKHLTPLLKKEEEKQAAFDQELIMALLPVLIRHLKHLNKASRSLGGLNFENFLDVAGNDIHPAVPLAQEIEDQNIQRKDNFYKKQVDLIFKLIFPKGKEDIEKNIPEIEMTDEYFALTLDSAEDVLALQLPQVFDIIFNKENIIEIFNILFQGITGKTEVDNQEQDADQLQFFQNAFYKEVAQAALTKCFSSIGTYIEQKTDIFTNPVLKLMHKAVLKICSFVIVKLIAPTLRFLKIERFVVNRLGGIIQHISEKSIAVLTQPMLHEDAVYHGIEAFETFLQDEQLEENEPLTEEERRSQMDQLVGELVIEVARFIDFPIDKIENLPAWAKRLTRIDSIQQIGYQSIGAAIREELDGEFITKALQIALSELIQHEEVTRQSRP